MCFGKYQNLKLLSYSESMSINSVKATLLSLSMLGTLVITILNSMSSSTAGVSGVSAAARPGLRPVGSSHVKRVSLFD